MTRGAASAMALVFLLCACGGEGDGGDGAAGFVGTTFPPLPPDLASGGMMTFPPDSTGAYGLQLVFGPNRQMLWLSEAAASQAAPGARRVLAVLDIPREEPNVSLIYTPGACRLDGTPDPEIVALARVQFTPVLEDVVLAWRADRDAGRFAAVPAERVTCRNPRFPAEEGEEEP